MASKSGDAAHNREPLSKARAEAVKKYLLDPKSGGKPAQITAEWVGADLAKLKEYEGDRSVLVFVSTPLAIEEVSFWNDLWTQKLEWDDIIGMDESRTAKVAIDPKTSSAVAVGTPINNVNLQVEVSGAPRDLMPDFLSDRLSSEVPNHENWGNATLSNPVPWNVERSPKDQPKDAARTWYRKSVPVAQIDKFLAWSWGAVQEVTFVVREGGTSDEKFRQALGTIAFRGRGEQSDVPDRNAELHKAPDAKRLLLAGGAEVLNAEVVAVPGWDMKRPQAARLIRSPADILYYSGHGLHKEGCLALHCDCNTNTSVNHYDCWAYYWELLAYWKPKFAVSVLIIAGCSVLDLDENGKYWANLLQSKGGPLEAILGYADEAPLDPNGGNDIATAMGKRAAGGSLRGHQWVQAWLDVNGRFHAWNAVGMDSQGYWSIDKPSRASKAWH
jgi:hypothetical protein